MSIAKTQTHFRGHIITVNVESVVLPNGHRAELEIVHHPGGAAVVAIDDQDRVCLLRQFRHAGGGWLWELPAGKLEPQEPPLVTAQRELVEEAGMKAGEWRSLGTYLSSPGVLTEVLHLFMATGLQPTDAAPEPNEVFEVHWIAFADAVTRAIDGDIRDGKTALGLLRAARMRSL
jgi:8-oxo-dGTP pyrophosphatase MutT (NUDIX family)